jgi:hypothetical protein
MRTGLVYLTCCKFSEHVFVVFLFNGFQQKKKFGENLQDFFSLAYVVCIDSICLDIIENFDYIGQVFFLFMQK